MYANRFRQVKAEQWVFTSHGVIIRLNASAGGSFEGQKQNEDTGCGAANIGPDMKDPKDLIM